MAHWHGRTNPTLSFWRVDAKRSRRDGLRRWASLDFFFRLSFPKRFFSRSEYRVSFELDTFTKFHGTLHQREEATKASNEDAMKDFLRRNPGWKSDPYIVNLIAERSSELEKQR